MFVVVACVASMLQCVMIPQYYYNLAECGQAAIEFRKAHPEYVNVGCQAVDRPDDPIIF